MAKYGSLKTYLDTLPVGTAETVMTFAQVEGVLGERLPQSAYHYFAWWANEKKPHNVQRQSWQDAGWRVKKVDLGKRWVHFQRLAVPRPALAGSGLLMAEAVS